MSVHLPDKQEQQPTPRPWEVIAEKIIVAEPERARVAIRAASTYRVVVEDNPARWEQSLVDFELIVRAVNAYDKLVEALRRAHACATLRDDGTCDGCPVSEALAEV